MTKREAMIPNYAFAALLAGVCVTLVAGCADDTGDAGRNGPTGPVIHNDGECTTQGLTASCTCPDKGNIAGRQTCRSRAWSACECAQPAQDGAGTGAGAGAGTGAADADAAVGGGAVVGDPEANKSESRFEWERTPFALGACKAGHYVGNFMGTYRSPVVWGFPVMVSGAPGADGAPGLEFWLEKTPGSGEVFSVNGGKLRGTANGQFPFSGDLTGTLDCAAKKYIGTIENGVYDVAGLKYTFVGEVTADYDKLQNSFINGQWILTEPATGNPFVGGELEWSAEWSAM